MFDIDWTSLFVPTLAIAEVVLRGSIMYLLLFTLLRLVRREAGTLGIADVLVVVLIADAAQNAMAGGYTSVTEGVVLVATIGFWDYLLDWLSFRFPWMQALMRPSPLPLIRNGRFLQANMKKEMITREELESLLRQQGVEDAGNVKRCFLEGDGHISVITRDAKKERRQARKKDVPGA